MLRQRKEPQLDLQANDAMERFVQPRLGDSAGLDRLRHGCDRRRESILLSPVTGGPGGYWKTFDWNSALRLGAEKANLPYSGDYGFARTAMYWPLSHMVAPKEEALSCTDCHGEGTRLDWKALGYAGDPMRTGGRK